MNTNIFILLALLSIGCVGIIYADEHGYWQEPLPTQKGGTVTPNYFPYIGLTNETNRTLGIHINVNIGEEELKKMNEAGISVNLSVQGSSDYFYEQTMPLDLLNIQETYRIPLNDNRLDSYRLCVWFDAYDNHRECVGYNTSKNVTFNEVDMTYQLKYVYKDIMDEKEDLNNGVVG